MENLILQLKNKEVRKRVNILILHDNELILEKNENENIEKIYKKLKKELKKKQYEKYNLSIIEDKNYTNKIKVSAVLILSNDVKKAIFYKYSKKIEKFRQDNVPIFIVTGGLRTNNIAYSISLTPYVFYINKRVESICMKIIEIMKIKERIRI